MQTLPRLFCRFRRFWFSQKSARLLFFSSARGRNPSAKRSKTLCGSGWEGKKKRFFREILCLLRISEKQDKPLAPDAKCRLWAIDAAAVCSPLLRATSDIFSLPPHHLIGFTALPFSYTFFMYPTPCPTSETVRKHRKSNVSLSERRNQTCLDYAERQKRR